MKQITLSKYAAAADSGITPAMANHPARVYDHGEGWTLVRTFDNLSEWAEVTAQPGRRGQTAEQRGAYDDFAGEGWQDALRMARGEGWQEALEQIQRVSLEVASLVDADAIADSFTYRYDVIGGAIDIGKFLTGEPECMIEAHPVPLARRGKVARIVVPGSVSSFVSVESIKRRGAAITSLVDALARAHYSLEVWTVFAGSGKGNRLAYAIKVCDAATKYDPALVAYGVGHPTMLRIHAHSNREHENADTYSRFTLRHGFYPSFAAKLTDLPEYAQNGPAIVLPEFNPREARKYETDEAIAGWVTETVQRIKEGELTQ